MYKLLFLYLFKQVETQHHTSPLVFTKSEPNHYVCLHLLTNHQCLFRCPCVPNSHVVKKKTFEERCEKESQLNKPFPHQTVQLGHRTFAARLAYVPDFDTAFATSVNMTCWVANGDGAHNFAVVQCVDLTGMTGNTGSDQGVRWKGHRLHLTICADVEGVGPGRTERWVSAHHHVTVCFHFLSKHQD